MTIAEQARKEIHSFTLQLAYALQRHMREWLRDHGTIDRGILSNSITVEDHGTHVLVGSNAPHAAPVNDGSRPHYPPVAAIEGWVTRKLGVPKKEAHGVARAICWKIYQEGTPPQPYADSALAAAPRLARDVIRRRVRGRTKAPP